MPQLDPVVLERILAFLSPLFASVVNGDTAQARSAAQSLLDSYQPRTNRELRHAALAIAFAFGSLDSLNRSNAPGIAISETIRLRANANALSRSAAQNEARYDRLRQSRTEEITVADGTLPASVGADDLLAFTRSAVSSVVSAAAQSAPLSRQQRRLQDREAAKKQRRLQEAERRAQALAIHRGLSNATGAPSNPT